MPNYGDANYWNDRYEEDKDSPFDWLFDFHELKEIIHYLMPQKDTNFWLLEQGMPLLVLILVINQQAARFPEQQWLTMDVLNMAFPDDSFPYVIDKSLIDTLLCYPDSVKKTQRMIDEIHRVMSAGARYITFSLHSIEEVLDKFQLPQYSWRVHAYRVKSSRWNEGEHRRRAVAHTMIICDKPDDNGLFPSTLSDPTPVPQVLNDDDYVALKAYADKVNLKIALQTLSVEQMRLLLFHSLDQRVQKHSSASFLQRAGKEALLCKPKLIEKSFEEVRAHCNLLLQEIAKREPPQEQIYEMQ